MMPMHSVSPVPEPAPAPHQGSRRGTAVMVAALLALAGLVTWWWLRDDAREVPVAPQAAQPTDTVTLADGAPQWAYLELAVAEAQPAITPSPAPGRVAFDEKRSAAVTSPLPGRVDEVRVRLGDQVKAGDKLVAVRSGALADLDRELESARSQVAAKTRVADRARELVGMRAAPEKDLLEAEEDLREAQLALKAAIAKRDSLNATIEGDTRFWITARQDGTVVEFDVAAGQQVGPDHDRPLLRLSHIDKVLVLTDLQEQDAYDVRVDTPATVRTAGGGVTRPGVVEYVSQVVDPQRRTVEVRVRVDNADGAAAAECVRRGRPHTRSHPAPSARGLRGGGERRGGVRGLRHPRGGPPRAHAGHRRPARRRRGGAAQRPRARDALRRQGRAPPAEPARAGAVRRGMLDRLVAFSLRNRAAVVFFTLIVAAWGWVSFRDLTVEAFPDPTDTQVNVITLFPGQPTEEVERQIGLPLERALNGTPGLATAAQPVALRPVVRHPHLQRRRRGPVGATAGAGAAARRRAAATA